MNRSIMFIALLVIFLLLSACQPTPESSIVISKNDGTLEAALETENEYDPMAAIYPEHWEAEYEELGGRLKVDIDADIIAKHKAYNVVKIEPYLVPIDQADKIIKGLFGTTDVYNFDVYEMTKSQIETLIIELKAQKAKAVSSGNESQASDLEMAINNLFSQQKNAPETTGSSPYNHTFADTSEYDLVQESINVKRDIDDDKAPFLSIVNRLQSNYSKRPEASIVYTDKYRQTYSHTSETSILGQRLMSEVFATEEAKAAIATATAFLGEIGAEDRVLQKMEAYTADDGSNTITGYKMSYGIQYDGVVLAYGVQDGASLEIIREEEQIFNEPFEFEILLVEVENNAVVNFYWSNILKSGSIIKENVALMPFEEIMDNLQNQLTAKYAYIDSSGKTQFLYVDQIILTYAVDAVKDKPGEYMLVPAWAFYGGHDYGDGYEMPNGTIKEGRYAEMSSLLTINAVDGTVIHGH